jgi:hypothetical protein
METADKRNSLEMEHAFQLLLALEPAFLASAQELQTFNVA